MITEKFPRTLAYSSNFKYKCEGNEKNDIETSRRGKSGETFSFLEFVYFQMGLNFRLRYSLQFFIFGRRMEKEKLLEL
jgi:hypothetical protein